MKTNCQYTNLIHAESACSSCDEGEPTNPTLADKVLPIIGNVIWFFLKPVMKFFLWLSNAR